MRGRFRQRITSIVAVAITMALPPTLFAQQATGLGLSIEELHELLAEATNVVASRDAVANIEDSKP